MLLNYTIIAWRNLWKSATFSLINIGGLAIGLAVALLVSQYVRFELSYEHSNPKADRVVRLTMDYLNGKTLDSQDAETYPPLGAKALREMSEVENYTRAYHLRDRHSMVKISDKNYQIDNVYAVDSSFFKIFHYQLIRGDQKEIFAGPRQAVVTEKMAMTYFNTLDVVSKTLTIPRSNKDVIVEIVGVVPNPPLNTHLKFDMVISYPTLLSDFGESEDNWDNNNIYTYLLLSQKTTYQSFTSSLSKFSDRLLSEKRIKNERVIGQKIGDIHLYSHKTFETEANGEARSVYLLLGVAALVLLGAFVNYVNLTTSRALDRAREIGVRKSVGSTQLQIRTQVLVETVLVNLAAAGLAILLVMLFQTTFLEMADLPKDFSVVGNAFFWANIGAFILLGVLLWGFYPALVMAAFEPVKVLKGSFTHSTKGALIRKSLVVFQFTITMILLVQTFVVFRQVKFLREQELGLNIGHTIVVKAPGNINDNKPYDAFKNMLLDESIVKSVSYSGTVPGMGSADMGTTQGITLADAGQKTSYNFYLTEIDTSFIEQMSLRLLAGKNFDASTIPGFSDTINRQLIVNLETLRLWGVSRPENAIGRQVDLWGKKATIRGVINNYHYLSPKDPHIPIIHFYNPGFWNYASIRFASGEAASQLATLKRVFEASFPRSPFVYFFLDNEYDKQYKTDDRFRQVFGMLTVIAIVISCMGLFGLATFTASKRTKEIGIRKVIGATTTSLVVLLSKEFLRLIAFSVLIAIPVTYFLADAWLSSYASHTELTFYIFTGPAIVVLLMAIISIGGKTIATALLNPVKSLRSE
ncbi:ABC transporter permease [Dyadobacter sp. CY261]|uniref:ABC transporter permease n=1 Tax=Dyadobacter sp. CY261 TaxID=2907203 RepID=UPI001F423AAE|nr:ABC transporter permease [Dyadobacter sp. CY261]MCF0074911.1 ABC transporter permease [Dyadobacter sp. CY261]